MEHSNHIIGNLEGFYTAYDEQERLSNTWGQVEFARSQSILVRYLPPPPATILDLGGAAGRYACWLAAKGYTVHLVDPVPRHIEQAQAASDAQPEKPIASCRLGDARLLEFDDAMAEVVLLMGPLYHLVEASDRHQALTEAFRVLKPGGLVFAVGISRFASTIDGLHSGYYRDPAFRAIMRQDLTDGQHRNPTDKPEYFTSTFFHHPRELESEVTAAGFDLQSLLAIEGIGYMMQGLDNAWADDSYRAFLLKLLMRMEAEPTLIGASPHIMCIGQKP